MPKSVELILTKKIARRRVFIFGDFTIDYYLINYQRPGGVPGANVSKGVVHDWQSHEKWHRLEKQGGAQMTRDMLDWYDCWSDKILFRPREDAGHTLEPSLKSLATMKACKFGDDHLPSEFKQLQYEEAPKKPIEMRVESFDGYSGNVAQDVSYDAETSVNGTPEVILINDAGNELRHSRETSPTDTNPFCECLRNEEKLSKTDVFLKMHLPLAQGLAWQKFKEANKARSRIVIVHADDLRAQGVPLSHCPSWDAVVSDFHHALSNKNKCLMSLDTRHDEQTEQDKKSDEEQTGATVVILFGVEGALIWTPGVKDTELVLDPMQQEGAVARRLPGNSIGMMNCFLTGLAAQNVLPGNAEFTEGTKSALLMARLYSESSLLLHPPQVVIYPCAPELLKEHEERQKQNKPNLPSYSAIKVATNVLDVDLMSILLADPKVGAYRAKAREIVENGVEATLPALPHGRFGKLWTVDKEEIEAMREVDRLISGYLGDKSQTKPVSIAVFGPPGSGKSFGVKQLVDEDKTPIREYNLSQADASQLPYFFHEIRDLNLIGKIPLCFFDEFDSQNLSLLKSFLAPMQDGAFLDGSTLRPIGQAIFVFAGGTSASMAAFSEDCEEPERIDEDKVSETQNNKYKSAVERHAAAKLAKLPDFVSRIHLSIDVKGPNPNGTKETDPAFILRRAILMRRFIEGYAPGVISEKEKTATFEPELLKALLYVEKYRHGARSMELFLRAIAQNSNGRSLQRSDLPPERIANAYVQHMGGFRSLLHTD